MFRKTFRTRILTMYFRKPIAPLSTRAEINNIFVTQLNLKSSDVESMTAVLEDRFIKKVSKDHIIQNCALIKNNEIYLNDASYLKVCLLVEPVIIRNRISVLKEMGSKTITLGNLYAFPNLMRKSLKQFKLTQGIPPEQDVMQNILSNVGITIQQENKIFMSNMTKAGDFYQLCITFYKTFYLKLEGHTFYKKTKRKYQSIREIKKLLDVLVTRCCLNLEFIRKHPYLMNVDVDNIDKLFTEFKHAKINDEGIIAIIQKYPRVLFNNSSEIEALLEFWKQAGLLNEISSYHIKALIMNKDEFLSRYKSIENSNILSIWLQHPRLLSLICNFKNVQNRLKWITEISENHLQVININTFLSSNKEFMKHLEAKFSTKRIKPDLSYIISKELGKENIPLIDDIQKHPYWKNVSIFRIHDTLQYLKEDYSIDDICQNIHIILYSKSQIMNTSNSLNTTFSQKRSNFTSSQYLALILYHIEKEHHFNGNGVWETELDEKTKFKSSCQNTDFFKIDAHMEYVNDQEK